MRAFEPFKKLVDRIKELTSSKQSKVSQPISRVIYLSNLLKRLNRFGKFKCSVLAAENGLLMAEAGNGVGDEIPGALAAMSSLGYETALRVGAFLSIGELEGIKINSEDSILFLKPIRIPPDVFLLGVLSPSVSRSRQEYINKLLRIAEKRIEKAFISPESLT
ncbi:MAG: hypothetical protein ACFE68_01515 [Candidatus Hodarchaeota archaeon]